MFAPLATILNEPVPATVRRSLLPPRTFEPVRRHSRLAGRCEGVFWRKTDRQEVRRVVLAARKYDLHERQPGHRNGPLGHIALEVLELLANLVSYKTGRLDPSLDYIAAKLRRSKDAVWRALKALRAHGFLDWLRRYVPTGAETGPKVQQTTNAYRLSLPAVAARLLGRIGQPVPIPDDIAHAIEQRTAELEAHKSSLPPAQAALFGIEDTGLERALSGLFLSMQERESAGQSESTAMKK